MQIRVATPQDIEAIRAVGVAAWHDTYPGIVPDGYIPWGLAKWWTPEVIQRHIDSERFIVLVAEVDAQVVGIAHTEIRPDQRAILWRLYIAQAFRGRGIGRALIAESEQRLPADSHDLYVEYYERNQRAAAFYAKLGFEFDHRAMENFEGEALVSFFVKRTVQGR
jgi:ribosomal protein S18 acetylase RimI-like enzyme